VKANRTFPFNRINDRTAEQLSMGLQDRPYLNGGDYRSPYERGGGMTLVTKIVIINVVVWLIDSFPGNPLTTLFALDTDLFREHYKVWTLLTCGFLHAPLGSEHGIWHILGNMFTLWFLGRQIEFKLGRAEFLRFYLSAIVLASLGWYFVTLIAEQPPTTSQLVAAGWDSAVRAPIPRAVGASGGVVAVLILFAFSYPKQPISIWGVFDVPAWLVGVFVVGSDILGAIGRPEAGIAFSAHLTGAAYAAAYHRFHWNLAFLAAPFAGIDWRRIGRRSKLKVHRPPASNDDKLAEQADRVLDKLHREGEASLTAKERRTLEAYSKKVRNKRPG
jgi:membrane associated rhomboid family serine protease